MPIRGFFVRPLALLFIATLALTAPAIASATPPPAPSPSPQATMPPIPPPKPAPEDPKIHKLAVQQFLAWQSGDVNRDLYADSVNAQLDDQTLDVGTKTLANLGGLQDASFQGISETRGVKLFVYTMKCQNGTVNMDFAVDPAGKISIILFL